MEGEAPFWEAVKGAFRDISEGGVDVTPLKDMLDKVVDEKKKSEIRPLIFLSKHSAWMP